MKNECGIVSHGLLNRQISNVLTVERHILGKRKAFTVVTMLSKHNKSIELRGNVEEEASVVVEGANGTLVAGVEEDGSAEVIEVGKNSEKTNPGW